MKELIQPIVIKLEKQSENGNKNERETWELSRLDHQGGMREMRREMNGLLDLKEK